jgi:hypothetical protein
VASPFLSAMNRVEQNVSPQAAPKTLFSSRSTQRETQLREPGQTPSP